jgi:hypothetical protein
MTAARAAAGDAQREDQDAERQVYDVIVRALGEGARVYPNVRWVEPTRPGGPARDGEVDILIVDPRRGLLAIEVKANAVRRDGFGRWFAGSRLLDESPFSQVETGKWAIARKIARNRHWLGAAPRPLHAVAFPHTDKASITAGGAEALGPNAPLEIILGRAELRAPEFAAAALARVFAYWSGDGARDRPLTDEQIVAIHSVLEPDIQLRPLLPGDIERGEQELLAPTQHQLTLLKTLRRERRALIEGGAGSGKTLLAIEKARQLATEGYNVLLVCFNQPLSKAIASHPALEPLTTSGRLTVSTFHELCRRLATEAVVLPPKPPKVGPEWFSVTLPQALDRAIPIVGGRWQALVVDEGQDFDKRWLESLDLLLAEPGEDVCYIFHDPAQAMFRDDDTAALGLPSFPIEDNCRNARPIHEFAYQWYSGSLSPQPLRDDGREPELVVAEPGGGTVDAVREVLHRLVHLEGVERSQIVVLTGIALSHSLLWKQRRFKGDLVLWNGSVDDAGESRALPADLVPPQPRGSIAIETIHRFKGLEREVVVVAELRPDDERLEKLLYVGATRAKHHLVMVVPPELSRRLGRVRVSSGEGH